LREYAQLHIFRHVSPWIIYFLLFNDDRNGCQWLAHVSSKEGHMLKNKLSKHISVACNSKLDFPELRNILF